MSLLQLKFLLVQHWEILLTQRYRTSLALEYKLGNLVIMKWRSVQRVKNALVQERKRFYGFSKEVPSVAPFPSYSNFILCEVKSGKDAKKLKVRDQHIIQLVIKGTHEAFGGQAWCLECRLSFKAYTWLTRYLSVASGFLRVQYFILYGLNFRCLSINWCPE